MTGLDPAICSQCGKCTAGCPVACEMDCKPHGIVRLLQLDAGEPLLSSASIWICLSCGVCTTRCPSRFDPAAAIGALREIVLKSHPDRVPRHVQAFHSAFLNQIRKHGRVYEVGLLASCKMRGRVALADVASVPGLMVRGKLPLTPDRIKGLRDLRRIFNDCAVEKP